MGDSSSRLFPMKFQRAFCASMQQTAARNLSTGCYPVSRGVFTACGIYTSLLTAKLTHTATGKLFRLCIWPKDCTDKASPRSRESLALLLASGIRLCCGDPGTANDWSLLAVEITHGLSASLTLPDYVRVARHPAKGESSADCFRPLDHCGGTADHHRVQALLAELSNWLGSSQDSQAPAERPVSSFPQSSCAWRSTPERISWVS